MLDPELHQVLTQLEARIVTRFDEQERRFAERLEATEHHFAELLEVTEHRFAERLEATETKLLSAFHNWAQTYEVRARGVVATVREFEERLGIIEERLGRLERRSPN
jgi:hypothetical protein